MRGVKLCDSSAKEDSFIVLWEVFSSKRSKMIFRAEISLYPDC